MKQYIVILLAFILASISPTEITFAAGEDWQLAESF